MSGIKGRHDDMLIIRGVNLFHTQVEALLEHHPEFSNNYQLIVERENNLDKVTVAIELSEYIYREIGNSIETLGEQSLSRQIETWLARKNKKQYWLKHGYSTPRPQQHSQKRRRQA